MYIKCLKFYKLNIIKEFNTIIIKESLWKVSKSFLKNKKKSHNMIMKVAEILQNMKKINWMSIEENIIEWEEAQYYNYKLAYTANDI